MNKIKCNLIVCGPAVGKTYLAERDNRFIDLDEMKAVYKYGLENVSRYDRENGKYNRGKVVNNDSYEYIIKVIDEIILDNKIGLLSFNDKILKYIYDKKIPYCLVYASKDSRLEYVDRMKKRGNKIDFIEAMASSNMWEKFYYKNVSDNNATYKIELEKGMYLSDIKDMFI